MYFLWYYVFEKGLPPLLMINFCMLGAQVVLVYLGLGFTEELVHVLWRHFFEMYVRNAHFYPFLV